MSLKEPIGRLSGGQQQGTFSDDSRHYFSQLRAPPGLHLFVKHEEQSAGRCGLTTPVERLRLLKD